MGNVSQRNGIFHTRLHLGAYQDYQRLLSKDCVTRAPCTAPPLPPSRGCACAHWPRPCRRLVLYLCFSSSHLPANHLSPSDLVGGKSQPACVSRSSLRKPADSGVRTRTSVALKRGGRPPRADVLAGSRLPALRRRSRGKVGPP